MTNLRQGCFNCGSSKHNLSSCTIAVDRGVVRHNSTLLKTFGGLPDVAADIPSYSGPDRPAEMLPLTSTSSTSSSSSSSSSTAPSMTTSTTTREHAVVVPVVPPQSPSPPLPLSSPYNRLPPEVHPQQQYPYLQPPMWGNYPPPPPPPYWQMNYPPQPFRPIGPFAHRPPPGHYPMLPPHPPGYYPPFPGPPGRPH